MSHWSYIHGVITVSPMGRTNAEKRYVLDTVLEHLPVVSGSEGDMEVYVIRKAGWNESSSHDEFFQRTNNLKDVAFGRPYRTRNRGWMRSQREYLVVVDAALRDRDFEGTKRDFVKWLTRFAKRVFIEKVLVEISGYDNAMLIDEASGHFGNMFEPTSWASNGKSINWCEYLMWDRYEQSGFPKKLLEKYGLTD